MPRARPRLLLTCEHGGNKIPARYRALFMNTKTTLHSHRGWDPGALAIAKHLAQRLSATLVSSETSRLLIDLNRSLTSETLLSEFSNQLPPREVERLILTHYRPYRSRVERFLEKTLSRRETAIHLSIHSFTPVLRGKRRDCQIGVLFDPSNTLEAKVAATLKSALSEQFPRARVRMNYPYPGIGDGFTSTLRRKLPVSRYAGIELEFNHAWLKRLASNGRTAQTATRIAAAIATALSTITGQGNPTQGARK
jgi:predicted N-formylglutamate amidohydrolase